jgi:hypothetical protein
MEGLFGSWGRGEGCVCSGTGCREPRASRPFAPAFHVPQPNLNPHLTPSRALSAAIIRGQLVDPWQNKLQRLIQSRLLSSASNSLQLSSSVLIDLCRHPYADVVSAAYVTLVNGLRDVPLVFSRMCAPPTAQALKPLLPLSLKSPRSLARPPTPTVWTHAHGWSVAGTGTCSTCSRRSLPSLPPCGTAP